MKSLFLVSLCFWVSQNCYAKDLPQVGNSCAVHIDTFEKAHNIPDGLLHAISKVESGRKDLKGRLVAWPWTINVEGQGYYFATKAEAMTAVINMMRQGKKSIDVGCMQVNLHHHPKAFKNLAEAFDPVTNVAYAARFLSALKNEHATWHKAVAQYHSANPTYHIPYRKSVLNVWNKDLKAGEISLAAGEFANFSSAPDISFEEQPVSRIRRFDKKAKVKVVKNMVIQTSKTSVVRRVTRGETRHIKRVS